MINQILYFLMHETLGQIIIVLIAGSIVWKVAKSLFKFVISMAVIIAIYLFISGML